MSIKNTITDYGLLSRLFHWAGAFLLLSLGIAGYSMVRLDPSDLKWTLYGLHKAMGLTFLGMIFGRLLWRFYNIVPLLSLSLPRWQHTSSKIMIVLLYSLMMIIPLSGLGMSLYGGYDIDYFSLFTIPAFDPKNFLVAEWGHAFHVYGFWSLVVLVGGHIGSALYHHFYLKDNVLKRMYLFKN